MVNNTNSSLLLLTYLTLFPQIYEFLYTNNGRYRFLCWNEVWGSTSTFSMFEYYWGRNTLDALLLVL